MLHIESRTDGVRFAVYAQPRASRTGIAGTHEDAVKVRLAAPPVDGAANAELIDLLARTLGVSKSAVRIVKGGRGRRKLVEVAGVSAAAVRDGLACR